MTDLIVSNVTVSVGHATLVKRASFTLKSGELIALLGPNGAGKTTLLRASMGLQACRDGSVKLGGDDVTALPPMQRARRVAYLPQSRPLAWPNRVQDIVALGRFSHGGALGRLGAVDANAVEQAISACDIFHLRTRKADTLSGGELARVHCARAFAAQAPLLIADEPVAALDPRHQFRVMDLIQAFVSNGGGALVVLHDIALASKYATRMIWMKDGAIVADGSPTETLTEQRIEEVYNVAAEVDGLSVQLKAAI